MNKFLQDVEEFQKKFGIDELYQKSPGFADRETMLFRIKFLLEELQEFANASGFLIVGDKVQYDQNIRKDLDRALDGLVDLLYVLKGTVLIMGMGDIFDEAWDRVQAANMQKERVKRPEDSKRGNGYDVVKPSNWKAPHFYDLIDIKKVNYTFDKEE